MEREPLHVMRDLGSKVKEDVASTALRTITLVEHPEDRYILASAALMAAGQVAVAVACKRLGLVPPEKGDAVGMVRLLVTLTDHLRQQVENEARRQANSRRASGEESPPSGGRG